MHKYIIWFLILPPSHSPLSEYENVALLGKQAIKALEPRTNCYRLQPSKTPTIFKFKKSEVFHLLAEVYPIKLDVLGGAALLLVIWSHSSEERHVP